MKISVFKLMLSLLIVSMSKFSFAQGLTYDWAKSFSGTSASQNPKAIAVDGTGFNGNLFSTGSFTGTIDFDPGPGVYNVTSGGSGPNVYVSKLDASGAFSWALRLGGSVNSGGAYGESIAIDAAGSIYIAGYYYGTMDFDPGPNFYLMTAPSIYNQGFVCKLKPNGDFVWAISIGGNSHDEVLDIAITQNGDIFATGYYYGVVDFDPGPSVFQMTSAGSSDIFVSKFDSSANFIWAKSMGGPSEDAGKSIAIDIFNRVYLTGYFSQTADFNPDSGVLNLNSSGGKSTFVTHLNPNGSLNWAKAFTGGSSDKIGTSIAVDGFGNVHTVGNFEGTVDFDPNLGTLSLSSNGADDIFISKLDNLGNLIWAKSMGGSGYESVASITIGANEDVYACGLFNDSVDFDPGPGVVNKSSNGGADAFLCALDSSGSFSQAITIGGVGHDEARAIKYAAGAYVYMTGLFADTVDFNPKPPLNNLSTASQTTRDIFMEKFQPCHISYVLTNQTSCVSYTSLVTNKTWTTSGTYFDTVGVNTNYCDSITIVNLTIIPISYDTISAVACGSYLSPSSNYTWTISGIYNDTLINSNNCDSIITVNLSINQPSSANISPVVCNSYTSPISNSTWLSSGLYYDTLTNVVGCDSIITINLTVNSIDSTFINPVSCDSFISPSTNYVWTTGGIYLDTLTNINNCDSIIIVNLSIVNIDSSVSQFGAQLQSNESSTTATYQWIDCINSFTTINGATNQSFSPSTNGSYAVIISVANCVDTSNCYTINTVGIDDYQLNDAVTIYPNPTENIINWKTDITDVMTISVHNSLGQKVLKKEVKDKKIELEKLATGTYFLKFVTPKGVIIKKFNKQ